MHGPLVFVWNNFGPMHIDRVEAVDRAYPDVTCIGVELLDTAPAYSWVSEDHHTFRKITLFHAPDRSKMPGMMKRLGALVRQRMALGRGHWFLCHYDRFDTLVLAIVLRLTGAKVYAMGCSKFDDMPRRAFREWLKTFYLRPYHGAIGSPGRSADYFRFLGFQKRKVVTPYNTVSLARMAIQAETSDATDASSSDALSTMSDGDWLIVARLVPKKNIAMAIEAFTRYRSRGGQRKLHICGDGPLEQDLRAQVEQENLMEQVLFHGFVQSATVSRFLARAHALVLPSEEEQFGNVVIEAQSLGVPLLISSAAGAADSLVTSWVNGFVFEPKNPEGLSRFMDLLDKDPQLHAGLSAGACETAPAADVAAFAEAVGSLAGLPAPKRPVHSSGQTASVSEQLESR